jgi:DDE superfamily endonuclease
VFRAVVADSAYGDQDGFRGELAGAGLPFVMALKPRRGPGPAARTHTPRSMRPALAWDGPEDPGDWTPGTRAFLDGHAGTWWAADARLDWEIFAAIWPGLRWRCMRTRRYVAP